MDNSTQCNLYDKVVRSFGTLTCNLKPATRDKCTTCCLSKERKNVAVQTVKNVRVVQCQTTFGSLSGTNEVACQAGYDGDMGHIDKVLYVLHNDRSLDNLQYQVTF